MRTWDKCRRKLQALGVLEAEFEQALDATYARLGFSAEGPRFFDPALLEAVVLPVPDEAAFVSDDARGPDEPPA